MAVRHSKDTQGWRVIQAGALLFLAAVLLGFVVPGVALPRVGLSAHLVGIMQGLLLMTVGQFWPSLTLGAGWSGTASVLVVGGCYSAWMGNVLAATWSAGGKLLPQVAGANSGSDLQELILALLLRGGGVALVAGWLVISWGLRAGPTSLGHGKS